MGNEITMARQTLQKRIMGCEGVPVSEERPHFFDLSRVKERLILENLFKKKQITRVIDDYQNEKEEARSIAHPARKQAAGSFADERPCTRKILDLKAGCWVFYPWRSSLVHILNSSSFQKLRLSRNQNLISSAEQIILSKAKIGIAGLNVGNPAAVALALEGVGKVFRLADFDALSLTNLNRFRAGVCDLGANKAILTARQMYEINPYLAIKVSDKGVTPGRTENFLLQPRLDILIEETDHLPLKIELREKAKKFKIPVIMATGNGANLILDVERYDINPRLLILNGALEPGVQKEIYRLNDSDFSLTRRVGLARDFIGAKWLTKKMCQSFREVGKTLAGIPQLAETSFLRGAVLCYATRQILLKRGFPSGRYIVSLDDVV